MLNIPLPLNVVSGTTHQNGCLCMYVSKLVSVNVITWVNFTQPIFNLTDASSEESQPPNAEFWAFLGNR